MDFDQTLEKYHKALNEFHKGRPEFVLEMFSERDDVSLSNPLNSTVRGPHRVAETAERAASYLRDGKPIHFETVVKVVTPDLAFVVENERSKVKVGERDDFSTVALRATAIFRLEESVWKILHRHADTVVSRRPAESLIEEQRR